MSRLLWENDQQFYEKRRQQQLKYKEELDAQIKSKSQLNRNVNSPNISNYYSSNHVNIPNRTQIDYSKPIDTSEYNTFQQTFHNDLPNYSLPIRISKPNELQQKLLSELSNRRANTSLSGFVSPLSQAQPSPTFQENTKFGDTSFSFYKAPMRPLIVDPKSEKIKPVSFNYMHDMKMEFSCSPVSAPAIKTAQIGESSRVSTPPCGFSVRLKPFKFQGEDNNKNEFKQINQLRKQREESKPKMETSTDSIFPNDLPMF